MNTKQTMRKSIHRSITLAALTAALSLGYSSPAMAQDAEAVAQELPAPQVQAQEGPQDFAAQDELQQNFQQRQQRGGGRGRGNQDPNNPDFQGGPGGGGRGRGGGGRGRNQDPNQVQDFGPGGGGRGRTRVDPVTGEVMQGGGGRTNAQAFVVDPNADSFTQEYGVIFQHNIFMRNRVYNPPVERGPIAPRPPEELNVLVGIVKEDDGAYRAYIEDVGQRMLHKLTLNDAIANGKITDVSMASIKYSVEGKSPVTVPVGANLTGALAAGSRLSTIASVTSRTDYTGFSQGQNNLPTNARGGRNNAQTGNFVTGAAAGQFNQQTFAGGAQGAGGRGRGGPGGQQFLQNAAPVLAPQPLPGTDNMTIEERMRLRRQTEGQPGAAIQMTGSQPTVAAPAAAPAPAPAAPIVDPSIGAGLSIEEQMRLRRLQEGQR